MSAEAPAGPTVPTRYWHALPDGRVQCDLCPRFCRLREGQRGLCFVRGRQGGGVVLMAYGRSSGFCVDPIEKKPLYHFLPGTAALSFGTIGCNLTCRYCQNWDISRSRVLEARADIASPERVAGAARDLDCRSVAFTYAGGSTFCPACGETVIGRGRHVLTAWNLSDDGACRFCGASLAGVFEGLPGSWDGRSLPVRLSPVPAAAVVGA